MERGYGISEVLDRISGRQAYELPGEGEVLAGEIIFKSEIKTLRRDSNSRIHFYQSLVLVVHLARWMRKKEYTYRLVVFDDDVENTVEVGFYEPSPLMNFFSIPLRFPISPNIKNVGFYEHRVL